MRRSVVVAVVGGLLAFLADAQRARIYAFWAGALIGTALLALIPEAYELFGSEGGRDVGGLALACLAGFFLFYALENLPHKEPAPPVLHYAHGHTTGLWAVSGIILHSFLDGVAIAQGLSVSRTVCADPSSSTRTGSARIASSSAPTVTAPEKVASSTVPSALV